MWKDVLMKVDKLIQQHYDGTIDLSEIIKEYEEEVNSKIVELLDLHYRQGVRKVDIPQHTSFRIQYRQVKYIITDFKKYVASR